MSGDALMHNGITFQLTGDYDSTSVTLVREP